MPKLTEVAAHNAKLDEMLVSGDTPTTLRSGLEMALNHAPHLRNLKYFALIAFARQLAARLDAEFADPDANLVSLAATAVPQYSSVLTKLGLTTDFDQKQSVTKKNRAQTEQVKVKTSQMRSPATDSIPGDDQKAVTDSSLPAEPQDELSAFRQTRTGLIG